MFESRAAYRDCDRLGRDSLIERVRQGEQGSRFEMMGKHSRQLLRRLYFSRGHRTWWRRYRTIQKEDEVELADKGSVLRKQLASSHDLEVRTGRISCDCVGDLPAGAIIATTSIAASQNQGAPRLAADCRCSPNLCGLYHLFTSSRVAPSGPTRVTTSGIWPNA